MGKFKVGDRVEMTTVEHHRETGTIVAYSTEFDDDMPYVVQFDNDGYMEPFSEDGLSLQLAGRKDDQGKLRYDLAPFDAIDEIVKVLNFGAKKYADRNWEKGMNWSRPYGALLRHMSAWFMSKVTSKSDKDEETGLSHLAHAGCCVLFLLAYELRGVGQDDRPNRMDG